MLFIIKYASGCFFSEDIKLKDLADRHEDWSAVSLGRSRASLGLDVLIVHGLLLFKFVLNGLELAKIALVHKHGSEVLISVPKALLHLFTYDCLKLEIANFSVGLTCRLETSADDLDLSTAFFRSTLRSDSEEISSILELK